MLKRLSVFLLALATVLIAGLAPAYATTTWTTWGVAPYASSREEAMRKLPDALAALGIPEGARELLQAEVLAHPEGTRDYLNPGRRLAGMMTGGATPHAMTDVVVGTNPVRRGVVQSAEASVWRVTYEGRIYTLVLPTICYNWAWDVEDEPAPREVTVEEECTVVAVEVRAGDILAPAVFTSGLLPRNTTCWGFRRSTEWETWPGGCVECIDWTRPLGTVPAADRRVQKDGRVEITQTGTVWFSVPRGIEAAGHHVAFYVVRDGLCAWGVIHPEDWANHEFTIFERNWVFRPS